VDQLPDPAVDDRRVALVVVGSRGPGALAVGAGAARVDVVSVEPSHEIVAAIRRAIDSIDHELVGVVLDTTEPLDATWLDRLVAALGDGVVAATPVLVHPRRPAAHATPHDGRVRAAGLTLAVSTEGVPTVLAAGAGTAPQPGHAPRAVDAASAACLVFERAAYEGAGGLPPGGDLDVAIVELGSRLRARGGGTVVVPGAVMLDHRPVRSKRDLLGPIDPAGTAWSAALDRSGPALLRLVRPLEGDTLRFAVTVAAPSEKVAARWGDWHLAEGLGGGLRRLGHEVRIQSAADADDPAGRACDVHLVLRGLQPVRRSVGQRHVLWIISHPESIEDDELDAADLVLVASAHFADHLRGRTTTPVEVFLQATDHHRFFPRPVDPLARHAVTVVAKTRDVLRPVVADALAVGLRPSIYGGGWRDLVDPGLVVADHVDNEQLPVVYSSAGVVLNDHWRTMQAWGFASNRLFDVLACGTPVISDPVQGVEELFDGAVLEYNSPVELRRLVDGVLADPAGARARAERGRAVVLDGHTFDHRAVELLSALVRHA
jgi:Glycosyl transferases group 1